MEKKTSENAGVIRQLISQIKGRTGKNGIWLYLLQIFNTVIPLLTLPYITRVFSTEDFGSFSIALNIFGYLQVLVEYGFALSVTRKVALASKDMDTSNQLFTRVFFARLLLATAGMLFAIVYSIIYHNYPTQGFCLIIMAACAYGYCLQINWFYQGMQDMKYISIVTIIGRSVLAGLTFLLVKSSADIYVYAVLTAILPLFSGIISVLIANRKFGLHFTKIEIVDIFDELKDGFLVFTTSLSSKVFGTIGVTFLGIFCTKSEVGIYSAIQRIPNVLVLAWLPIAQILYPISSKRVTESFTNGKEFVYKVRKYVMIPFVLLAAVLSLFSNFIVKIAFGAEYATFSYWMIPLLIWLIISINNNFLGHQILLSGGYDKEYSMCFQINVAITIILNLVLILLWGGTGASLAPLISEMCLTSMELYQIKRIENAN